MRRCRRHTAPQQGVDGALMAQDLQQGRDVRGVGEGNVVHHSGPLGGHVPRSSGEDETLRRTGIQTKPFVPFSSTQTHFCAHVTVKYTNLRKTSILLIFFMALCVPWC